MLRLFIAVELSPGVREQVAEIFRDIAGARWVNPNQTHITLRFLGATPEARLASLIASLGQVRQPRLSLSLRGVGVFPENRPRKPPRVLWLGLVPAEPLVQLKKAIDEVLGPDAEQKEFSPHLTLARFPKTPGPDLDAFLDQHRDFQSGTWQVSDFVLMKSTLHPSGSIHERLASLSLIEP